MRMSLACMAALLIVSGAGTAQAQTRERPSQERSDARIHGRDDGWERRAPPPERREESFFDTLKLGAEGGSPRKRGWNDPLGGTTQNGRGGH